MKSKDWRPTAFAETAPGVVTEEDAEASRVDRRRALLALLRQMVTLDAVALLLTVTLVGRAFAQPVQRGAVTFAVAAFLLGLAGAGATFIAWVGRQPRVGAPPPADADSRVPVAAAIASFVAFAVGLGALSWFFLANWLR